MKLDGKLIVVPEFIFNTLKTKGLPLRTLTCMNELKKHFTVDDISTLNYVSKQSFKLADLQNTSGKCEALEIVNSFNEYDLIGSAIKKVNCSDVEDKELNSVINNIEKMTLVKLNSNDINKKDIVSLVTESYGETKPVIGFKLELLCQKHCKVFALVPVSDIDVDVDTNMRILFNYYLYDDVCRTSVFNHWCKAINSPAV